MRQGKLTHFQVVRNSLCGEHRVKHWSKCMGYQRVVTSTGTREYYAAELCMVLNYVCCWSTPPRDLRPTFTSPENSILGRTYSDTAGDWKVTQHGTRLLHGVLAHTSRYTKKVHHFFYKLDRDYI